MKAIKNWDNVQAVGGFETLPAGGYVCEIKAAKEKPNRSGSGTHLEVMFDVDEGEYKGFFAKDYKSQTREDKFWSGTIRQNVPDEASPKFEQQAGFFKRFIANIEESNPGYHWGWDESTLAGKKIGVIFGEREKQSKNGRVYTVTYAENITTVEAVKLNDYTVPPVRRLPEAAPAVPAWVADAEAAEESDLPF